ncbi:hypothetical protein [Coleofasciculus sp. FACHB-125]|uniref:hypothetical protein n=1 Tax=Coleofasciculus sp. FACHB-125 TaxID=2692784 RepID=UPI0016885DDC|nr:hypothetical protein [Coleofasciculus sp. FACHB-125]MBD1900583.1 hypothetical protein [Coleofasciculus sp. FACHB-125]
MVLGVARRHPLAVSLGSAVIDSKGTAEISESLDVGHGKPSTSPWRETRPN